MEFILISSLVPAPPPMPSCNLTPKTVGKREFICIQIPEPCDEKSEACKVGYKTIADIGKERIRRIIKQDNTDDGYKIFKLQKSNFKTWHGDQIRDKQELEKQMKLHITPLVEDAQIEDVLYELLLKSGLSLTAEIENKGDWFLVRDLDITIALALESIDEATIKTILAANPQKFITTGPPVSKQRPTENQHRLADGRRRD